MAIRSSLGRLSVAYGKDKPDFLNQSGPFALVRHPFYTSYLCSYASGLIASQSLVLLGQTCIMLFIYYQAARFEEDLFSNSSLVEVDPLK